MQLVVGSSAMGSRIACREPLDIDIWTNSVFTPRKGFDYKTIPIEILSLVECTYLEGNWVATLNSLYTIKCSHLGWDNPNWDKHKLDLLTLKHHGCVLHKPLYDALVEYWKTKLGDKSFLSLNKQKQEFFTDNIPYVYDHDWLHEQVAYPNEPIYKQCLVDGADVLIDKGKFDLLPFDQQVRMFREEITVIAIERWLVNPSVKGKWSWVQAYMKALKKTITTLTKGWATEFIVMNMEYFVKPEYNYFKYALEATKDN